MTEGWRAFKEQVMKAAYRADEKSTLDMFGRDAVGRELGVDMTDPEQTNRLERAVNELVNEKRLTSRSKFNEDLSL